MSGVRVALDTTTAVAILNENPYVLARQQQEGPLALPAAVVAELRFGALNSGLKEENVPRYEEFIKGAFFLDIDLETTRCYAELRLQLKRAGRPLPMNDLWIAASCLRHGLVLVAEDGHFGYCAGLQTENWLPPLPKAP